MSDPIVPVDAERLAELHSRLDDAESESEFDDDVIDMNPPAEVDISDLIPISGNYPTETVQYRTVVLTDIPARGTDNSYLQLDGPVRLDDERLQLYKRPGEGVIITSQQNWIGLGVTLGRLLHSLALAPGESTRVAVVDWTRQDAGTGTDAAEQRDKIASETDDTRRLGEQATSTARQTDEGSSSTSAKSKSRSGGVSAGFAGFFGGIGGTLSTSENQTMATTVARSASAKEASVSTVQDIAARTRQQASAVRSRQATVIKEANQTEGAKASTRVVTNYNHMHAMSVQYYEVVQNYEVRTFPARIDRCVFIPLEPIMFTGATLRRHFDALVNAAPPEWAKRIGDIDPFAITVSRTGASQPRSSTFERIAESMAGEGGQAHVWLVVDAVRNSPTMRHLSAASDGTVWAATAQGEPVNWNGSAWIPVTDGLGEANIVRVAVARRDLVWALDDADRIYRRVGDTAWSHVTGRLRHLVTAADGTTWGINSSDELFRLTAADPVTWQRFHQAKGTGIAVAKHGKMWHIGTDKIYDMRDADNTRRMTDIGHIVSIAAAADETLFALSRSNDLLRWDSAASTFVAAFDKLGDNTRLSVVAPVFAGEVWGLRTDGRPVRIRNLSPSNGFDDSAVDGTPSAIMVWWDDNAVRRVELTTGGVTGRVISAGDPGAALNHRSFVFDAQRPPEYVKVYSGPFGGGSVRQIVIGGKGWSSSFGPEPVPGFDTGLEIPLTGVTLCGLFGSTGTEQGQNFLASLGFYVRGPARHGDVLEHLNANRDYYSQAVWANLDDLTIGRLLATYTYTPSEPDRDGGPGTLPPSLNLPLGVCVDPKPVAITGNYLAFRWNYPTETARQAWLGRAGLVEGDSPDSPNAVIAVPSAGVFAEAVLGRSNSAEKLDVTRFWNWSDSTIPILPPEITPVGLDSRARDLDLSSHGLDPALAQLQQLRALPDPTGITKVTETMVTKLFTDMSKATENASVALQGLKEAAANDRTAGTNSVEVYKAALEHYQANLKAMLEAAEKLLPLVAPELAAAGSLAGAVGGSLGSGGAGNGGLLRGSTPSLPGLGTRPPSAGGASAGRSISEAGGLLNMLTGTGSPASGEAISIDTMASELVRDIGVPALRAALGQDPALANLPNDKLSQLLSKAIVTSLQNLPTDGSS